MLPWPDPGPRSTFHHVVYGPVHSVLVGLTRGVQVLEDVDVWSKVDHVLLTAAGGQLDQGVQAADGRAEDVAFVTSDMERKHQGEERRLVIYWAEPNSHVTSSGQAEEL